MPETIKIRDKDFSFAPNRREGRVSEYNYLDPIPPDMKGVELADLCPVSIDWKMLTTLRPKTKIEEDMFSRLVQLGKLDLKYQAQVKRTKDTDWVRKTKNPRSSIVETRVLSCKDCGEDFCDGSLCSKLTYENFFRIQPSMATGIVKDPALEGGGDVSKKSKKKQRRGRKRTRTVRERKLRKNSIFNRPASRGCSRDHSRRERAAASVLAERSSSHDRARPSTRRSSISPAPRAKSAPRIHFKGIDSDGEGARKSGFTSESAVSQSDYSTQSESESPHRRVDFAKTKEGGPSGRSFVRRCTLSDGGEWTETHRRRPFTAGEWQWRDHGDTTSDNSDTSPSPDRLLRRRPATIHLEFDPSSVQAPSRVIRPPRLTTSSKSADFTKGHEMKQMVRGLTRVELSFVDDDEPSDRPVMVRRRQRLQRSAALRSHPIKSKAPAAFLQGKALFSKSSD